MYVAAIVESRSLRIGWTVAPSLLLLISWFLHVAHTYASFGTPYFMSDVDYGPWLQAHTSVFRGILLLMWLSLITLAPIATVVCALRRRWRPAVPFILVGVACVALSIAVIIVATPQDYMEWFLD